MDKAQLRNPRTGVFEKYYGGGFNDNFLSKLRSDAIDRKSVV